MLCSPVKEWILDIMILIASIDRYRDASIDFPKDRKRSESLFANTRVARAAAGHVLRVRQSTKN